LISFSINAKKSELIGFTAKIFFQLDYEANKKAPEGRFVY